MPRPPTMRARPRCVVGVDSDVEARVAQRMARRAARRAALGVGLRR
ncbi:hypothetical protein E1A91_A09G129300v1 [Gossypium mustelinum]|uniref:Uncharacterized protein n=4 Tax=Gossypium TaxID=3633 RepID=A0A5J5UDM7_GOSBA|nr:hypothetical protein ES319_A09G127300v1 [Gossypium barbadense]TYH02537.1 hypothetical protein ES288_A09G148500v1 [Gossypium darwinii]TYI10474.1 hypothetical protein ES332_A09G143200v1 [Gossypium tomentosum]TYJ18520.1 hypothetical protein E1A91_A09G129300v1 [Gossypium mustelinum]